MLLRGLSYPNKWNPVKEVNREDGFLAGDNLTELRTTKNMLSVWLANSEEDIEDAIVAMMLNKDKPCKFVGFLLDEKELKKIEIDAVDNEMGKALGADNSILMKHRNLVEMDFWRLGYLTQYMVNLAKECAHHVIKTKDEVIALLNRYKGNKITADKIGEKLRENLKW